MSLVNLSSVARLVVEEHGAAPGAVVAGAIGELVGLGAAGRLSHDPGAGAVDADTPFDLASVTKPVVALTLARLERRGVLARGEPLGEVLRLVADTPSAGVPLDLLAAHRSGLEAHIKIYEPLLRGATVDRDTALRIAAGSRRADALGEPPSPGFAPVYSDMGYLLLGAAIEARTGEPLDVTVRREVLAPLGVDRTVGSARQLRASMPRFDERVAPTEDLPFRGGVVRGLVHDENAFAISGDALSGHAGLFGDARSVLAIGRAVLGALSRDDGWLGPDDLAPLVAARPGGSLLAGFDRRSGDAPSSGARLGPSTFGHLGFTGTSLWIDPESRFVGVLLTNRVHPTREHLAIRAARPRAYDAMFDALAAEAGRLPR
jgi:CubicO group peptidase (beta-lactamase class C family)